MEFRYEPDVDINDIEVVTGAVEGSNKGVVKNIIVRGESLLPSKRFWTSLHARFSLSPSIYSWFDHNEVLERIRERSPSSTLRLTIQDDGAEKTLLGIASPNRPIVNYEKIIEVLGNTNAESHAYEPGIVRSTHKLANADDFEIFGDVFKHQFTMDTPIDGYGLPQIYLTMMRQVCLNGMIAYAKVFRTTLKLGKKEDDTDFTISRFIDSFNNEEGYHALRDRIESAGKSWASLNEVCSISETMRKAVKAGEIDNADDLENTFMEKIGDPAAIYGIASFHEVSKKRLRSMPSKATVYDLLTFATEVATHHAKSEPWKRQFQAKVGDLIGQEYDMEGTCAEYETFDDWFVQPSQN